MKKILVVLFALISAQAFGQGYSSTVLQNSPANYGRPVPYPQVLVCVPGDTNVPCISRATTYFDDTLTTQCTQTGSSGLLIGNPTSGPNCNNPGIGDVNGNFTIYVAGGEYMICTYSGTWLCQKQTIGGGNSGSGIVNSCTGANCDAYYPFANTPSIFGDTLATDDGSGNKAARSYQFTDPFHSGNWFESKGPALPSLNASNSVYFSINPNFPGNTYGFEAWDNKPTPGDCVDVLAGDATNWVKLGDAGAPCGSGGGGGSFPTTQIATPAAPTLANQNAAGARSITYKVVACEDVNCTLVTLPSSAATIANANASPQVLLSAYADTLYGADCYDIYVTVDASRGALGKIAHCVGKKFIDTGAVGDGTSPPSTNNTVLVQSTGALPGCNIPLKYLTGPDAQPCSPNALDDELRQTFGAPADAQDPFFGKYDFNSATAQWSGGTIILTSDTNASQLIEALTIPLPATPFTFEIYISSLNINSPNTCGLGLAESTTNHNSYIGFLQDQNNTVSANGGTVLGVTNTTSTSISGVFGNVFQDGFWGGNSGYLKVQDDGTTLRYSFSNTGDGVNFKQMASQPVSTPFPTNLPTVLTLVSSSSTNGSAACSFDFARRTQ